MSAAFKDYKRTCTCCTASAAPAAPTAAAADEKLPATTAEVLDNADENKKLTVKFADHSLLCRQTREREDLCAICFDKKANYLTEGCCHSFCVDCIDRWFRGNKSCPTCRSEQLMTQFIPSEDKWQQTKPSTEEILEAWNSRDTRIESLRLPCDTRMMFRQQCGCFFDDCKRSTFVLAENGYTTDTSDRIHPVCFANMHYACEGCNERSLRFSGKELKKELCILCRRKKHLEERYVRLLKAHREDLCTARVAISRIGQKLLENARKTELASHKEEARVLTRFARTCVAKLRKDELVSVLSWVYGNDGHFYDEIHLEENTFYPSLTRSEVWTFNRYSSTHSFDDCRCRKCDRTGIQFRRRYSGWNHNLICPDCERKERIAVETFVNENGGWKEGFFPWPDIETDILQKHTPTLFWNDARCDVCDSGQLFLSTEDSQQYAWDNGWNSDEGDHFCPSCCENHAYCDSCDHYRHLDSMRVYGEERGFCGQHLCEDCYDEKEKDDAATLITKMARGFLARKDRRTRAELKDMTRGFRSSIIVRSFGGPYRRKLMRKWTALSRKEGMYWTHRNCNVCHETALIFSSHENAYTAGNVHHWNGWTCRDHSREYTVCRGCTTLHHKDSFRTYKGRKCCQWCYEKDTNLDAKLIQKFVRGFLYRQGRMRVETFMAELHAKKVDHHVGAPTNALVSAWMNDAVTTMEHLQKHTPPKYEWESVYCDDCKKTQFILHDARTNVHRHHWSLFNGIVSLTYSLPVVSVLPDGCDCDVATAAAAATTIQRVVRRLRKRHDALKKQNEELKKRKRDENVETGNKRARLPELRK